MTPATELLPALDELMRLREMTTQGDMDTSRNGNEETEVYSSGGSLIAIFAHECIKSRIETAEANAEFYVSSHNLLPEVARQVGEVVGRLEEAERENERLREFAIPMAKYFAARNPKHEWNGVIQDPCGVHAFIEETSK